MECLVIDLGRISFQETLEWQRHLARARAVDQVGDVVLLAEHPHTFSFGKKATIGQLLWDEAERARRGVALVAADRGGGVTYHGPGQLIIYPIIKLGDSPDLHQYLRKLEEAAIGTLSAFNVEARRIPGFTGVWVEGQKIASIGVGFTKGVTRHGLSLNISCDLSYFEGILACGLSSKAVSMESLGIYAPFQDVARVLVREFAAVFKRKIIRAAGQELSLGNEILRKRGCRSTYSVAARRGKMPYNGDLYCAHRRAEKGSGLNDFDQRIRIMGEHAAPEGIYRCGGGGEGCAIHSALGCWPKVAECRFATHLEPKHGFHHSQPRVTGGVFCPGEDLCSRDSCTPEPKLCR